MPIEVAAIQKRVATCTLDLGEGGSITLGYYPAKVSRLEQDDFTRLSEETAGQGKHAERRALAALLCDLVTHWDVTHNKEPFPLDPDMLADTLDDAFLQSVLLALATHVNAGKVSGEVLRMLGTATMSPMADQPTELAKASPAHTTASASRPKSRSQKSPVSRA